MSVLLHSLLYVDTINKYKQNLNINQFLKLFFLNFCFTPITHMKIKQFVTLVCYTSHYISDIFRWCLTKNNNSVLTCETGPQSFASQKNLMCNSKSHIVRYISMHQRYFSHVLLRSTYFSLFNFNLPNVVSCDKLTKKFLSKALV